MGEFGQLASQVYWLGKLALVFSWVQLDFFSLECSGMSSSEF